MRSELRAGPVFGTLPLIYVFLARAGKTIIEAETVVLDRDGNLRTKGDQQVREVSEDGAQGARIVFSDQSWSRQTLYYFSGDVSNGGLSNSGLLNFCNKLGSPVAFIKSASYLLHRDRYSELRRYILDRSTIVLQDDSGIPVSYFEPSTWNIQPFGNYIAPIPLFRNRHQTSLACLFRVSDRKSWISV